MTDKEQKSAEVAQTHSAVEQKSTEVQDVATATDGVTRIISIPGRPLMVTLIAFNRLVGRIKELEAELEAVGAGGVQALSAAPAVKNSTLRTYPNPIVPLIKPVSEQEKMRALYVASTNLMVYLGRNGAIHSDGHAADAMMDCLNDLDGGEFDETLFAASPTPPAEQPAGRDEDEALDLLAILFEAWENGPQCYDGPEGDEVYVGQAFRLDDDVFHRCVDLLTRRRSKTDTPKAEQQAPKAAPAWEHHARKLTQWLHCMSHNDSYFGEPAGLVKQVTGELNRLIGAAPPQEAQEAQEPTVIDQKTMELAESVGLIGPASRTHDLHAAIQRFHDLICVDATIKAARMAADILAASSRSAGGYPPLPMQFAYSGVFPVYSADQMRAYVDADRAKIAAPQQEAQEPVATAVQQAISAMYDVLSEPDRDLQHRPHRAKALRAAIEALESLPAAPQPAPAPLSERDAFEAAWEKLHGKRPVLWSHMFAEHKMETPSHSEGKYFARDEQAAWKLWKARAALAAQGGKA